MDAFMHNNSDVARFYNLKETFIKLPYHIFVFPFTGWKLANMVMETLWC